MNKEEYEKRKIALITESKSNIQYKKHGNINK